MLILYVLSVLSFLALLWAAVSIVRHIRLSPAVTVAQHDSNPEAGPIALAPRPILQSTLSEAPPDASPNAQAELQPEWAAAPARKKPVARHAPSSSHQPSRRTA